jgi:hypothetical protein
MQILYVGISLASLLAIAVLLILNRRKIRLISSLTMLGMTLTVLGIIFGASRWIGYSLIGAGVLLALIDAKQSKMHREG